MTNDTSEENQNNLSLMQNFDNFSEDNNFSYNSSHNNQQIFKDLDIKEE